jgi:PAS domain S-box-containing protein
LNGFSINALRLVVGTFCCLIGVVMLVTPHELSTPLYVVFQSNLNVWGTIFLILGIALVAMNSFPFNRQIEIVVFLLSAGALLTLAIGVGLGGGWTGTINFGVLGLATAIAPFVAYQNGRTPLYQGRSLFGITIGTAEILTGLLILFAPAKLTGTIFDSAQVSLAILGIAFFVVGVALTYIQLRPLTPRAVYWLAHLLAGGIFLVFCFAASIPNRATIGIIYYGGVGLTIMLLPAIEPRLRHVVVGSLQTRLSFLFALVGSLPVILLATITRSIVFPGTAGTLQPGVNAVQDTAFSLLLVVVAIAVVSGILVARRLAAPMLDLTQAASRLSSGDTQAPLPTSGPVEIATLSGTFAIMRDQLTHQTAEREELLEQTQTTAEQAEQERAQLEAVFQAMTDGITIWDTQANLVLLNDAEARINGFASRQILQKQLDYFAKVFELRTLDGLEVPVTNWPVSRVLRGESFEGLEMLVKRQDIGRTRIFSYSGAPVKDENEHQTLGVIITRDITEQKHTELQKEQALQALSESEERFRVFIDNAPAAIAMFDRHMRYLAASHRWLVDYGLIGQNIIGKSHYELFPELPDQWKEAHKQGMTGAVVKAKEDQFQRPDGTTQWLRWEVRPWYKQGKVGGIVIFTEDITERIQAEKERERLLAEVERRAAELRATIESMVDGVFVSDAHGKVILTNQAALQMSGMSGTGTAPPKALPQNIQFRHLDGAPMQPSEAPLPRALAGEIMIAEDGMLHNEKTGKDTYIRTSAAPIRNTKGNIIGAVVVNKDITQLIELQKGAQQRVAELRATIDSIADAVFVTDLNGKVTFTNSAGRHLLGMNDKPEQSATILVLPEYLNMRHLNGTPVTVQDMPFTRAIQGELVETQDIILRSPITGADLIVRSSAAPIRDEHGKIIGAVAVARDITELIELDRMKDDFIKVAAHELRTPVTIVKGYAQAIGRTKHITDEQRESMLAAINEGSNRITRVVEDLLDISQLQIGKLSINEERLDLGDLVENVVHHMAPFAPKNPMHLRKINGLYVNGDESRLKQVVKHLLENAIKFSPEGGPIDITLEQSDHEAIVAIRDQGVGIPKDRQTHIFERFYRAHTGTPFDYGGMGVGLYISHEIVHAHHGRIWFKSEEGKGSTFFFALPLA